MRGLREWAQKEKIALTVVGPEAPLAAGVVDEFRAHGLRIFGPTKAAAQLESSKAFSKAFMRHHGIPTADYDTFTDPAAAHAFVDRLGAPIVIKADGLAAGKGVVVAMNLQEAHDAVDFMLVDNKYGAVHNEGGARVVIEEFLEGEEASFIVLCDGKNVAALATSQDHKRLQDGDQGPNTGGMGAYSPAPWSRPTCTPAPCAKSSCPPSGAWKGRHPFTGFLYAGLMIDAQGQPKTLEFNCRMGDPETQPILMRLKSDLCELLGAAVDGKLDQVELQWDRRTALGVVMAAHGYPEAPRKGRCHHRPAAGPGRRHGVPCRHRAERGVPHTSGGRVLCVTALGDSVRQASSAPTMWRAASISMARRCAATLVTAPSRTHEPALQHRQHRGPRAWLPGRSAGAHHRCARSGGRCGRRAPSPTRGTRRRRAAAGRRHHPHHRRRPRVRAGGLWFLMCAASQLPPSATQHRPELAGAPFEAMGVSLVFTRAIPIPTVHMNVRMIAAGHPGQAPVCWFGGGMDLTPYYGFEEGCRALPPQLPRCPGAFGDDKYPRFKQWCDEYFSQTPQRAARRGRRLL